MLALLAHVVSVGPASTRSWTVIKHLARVHSVTHPHLTHDVITDLLLTFQVLALHLKIADYPLISSGDGHKELI